MGRHSAQEKYLPALEDWLLEREKRGDWPHYLRATGLNLSDIQEEAGIPRKHLYQGKMKIRIEEALVDLEERDLWTRSDCAPTPKAAPPSCNTSDEVRKRDREIQRLKTLLAEKTAEVATLRNRKSNSIEALAPLGGRLFPPRGGS